MITNGWPISIATMQPATVNITSPSIEQENAI